MAAVQMGVTTGGNVKQYIGTYDEMAAVPETGLGAGSTYWAKDTKAGYIWDGSAWTSVA